MKVIWSPEAIEDLISLRAYIGEHNPGAASKVVETLLDAVRNLEKFPGMGRPGRVPNTRELLVPHTPYLVPYTVTERGLEIIAIVHMARCWQEGEP